MTKADEPIADPAERAKAVAKILRGRGIPAKHASVFIGTIDRIGGKLVWYFQYSVNEQRYEGMGPRAIADAIQAEEAKRAQQWAGDPMTDAITCELETLDDGTVAVRTTSPVGATARDGHEQLHRREVAGAIAIPIPDGTRVMIVGPRGEQVCVCGHERVYHPGRADCVQLGCRCEGFDPRGPDAQELADRDVEAG